MNGNDRVARRRFIQLWGAIGACCAVLFMAISAACAQDRPLAQPELQQRFRALSESVDQLQVQLRESQKELEDLKQQISAIRDQAGMSEVPVPSESTSATQLAEAVANIREAQALQETQIATLEQTKVETTSKYPLKLSGMILMTGFVNTRQMDVAATPTVALAGPGSTGATLQQTILGLDASGPSVFGARSHADLRFDLNGAAPGAGYRLALLRVRTAHAELNWSRTRAFFALDRTLLNPETPTSITAVAEPALAWSGNLWAWNPQIGISHDLLSTAKGAFRAQAALTDIANPPQLFAATQDTTYTTPSTEELSRWPGVEARLAWEDDRSDNGVKLGMSGIFEPHRSATFSRRFNSWAGALDLRLPFTRYTQLSGSAYRGAALGGLGAGTYKDFVVRTIQGESYFRALEDMGGWVQWKQRVGERLEFNEAFGIDNVPASQLRFYALSSPVNYYNLARNRTFTGNVIYSPSAYLLLSLEYRRIASSYVTSPTQSSDVIGIGAGYKF